MAEPAVSPDGGSTIVIVVPCHNEAKRLDEGAFRQLALSSRVRFLFVDDGSTDDTARILTRLEASFPCTIGVLRLPVNRGKAEAVRRGLRHAITAGPQIVGYYDADLSTPPSELLRLIDKLQSDDHLVAVMGSRVARMGSTILRSPLRHYFGRIYATLASWALGIAIYDSQCGAKVFRVSPLLRSALEEDFRSAWAFDVILLARLRDGTPTLPGLETDRFLEEPLRAWSEVPGSKLRSVAALRAAVEVVLLGIRRRIRRSGRWPQR